MNTDAEEIVRMSSGKLEMRDEELVAAFRAGELQAFDQLVLRYQDRMVARACILLNHQQDACDAAQEALLKVYRQLHTFRGTARFATWLNRILVNQCLDQRRKRKLRAGETSLEAALAPEDERAPLQLADEQQPSARQLVVEQELEARIMGAVDSLPEHHRTVILLREVEELSYQDIAETMGTSIGTVMSRLHHARLKLQRLLGPWLESPAWTAEPVPEEE